MKYLENSEEITGYRVKIWEREAFKITGYTYIVPPSAGHGPEWSLQISWSEIIADGRLDKLINASSVQPWVLGLGSWDPECGEGFRYTICIEETAHTDFSYLSKEYDLYTQKFAAVDWMCFEVPKGLTRRFLNDNAYVMLEKLGYQFCWDPGVHFDAYPPDYDFSLSYGVQWAHMPITDDNSEGNPVWEYWISVMLPKVATVYCNVEPEQNELLLKYDGPPDCRKAHSVFADFKSGNYRCFGYGSCAEACRSKAIVMDTSKLPIIDKDKCIACGACVRTCPRGIITLIPKTQKLPLS